MTTLILLFLFGGTTLQETPQERPKVPKDSIELSIVGCLTGRVLAVSDVRQTDTQNGPIVRARTFRLAAKGDLMKDIKREDHHFVEVTGIVRRTALIEPGVRIGKRITVGGGSPTADSGASRPVPPETIPVMDVSSVRLRSTSCSGGD
jgi:hypothetical protein